MRGWENSSLQAGSYAMTGAMAAPGVHGMGPRSTSSQAAGA